MLETLPKKKLPHKGGREEYPNENITAWDKNRNLDHRVRRGENLTRKTMMKWTKVIRVVSQNKLVKEHHINKTGSQRRNTAE